MALSWQWSGWKEDCLRSIVHLCFTESGMKLLTAHKILISAAVIFFLFFALWELQRYLAGDGWAGFRGVLYVVVAAAFGVYLKQMKRLYK